MNNKVLVKLLVPELNSSFDIFLPVNEIIWKIKKMLVKSISDLTNVRLNPKNNYVLINAISGTCYTDNITIHATDIRNASTLILGTYKSQENSDFFEKMI